MYKNTHINNVGWKKTLEKEHTPILIYQMGKVGSSALESSIHNSIHLHDLMCIDAEKQISPIRAKLNQPLKNYFKRYLKREIFRYKLKRKKQVKIISLIREPIGRNMSMFFQALPFWMAQKYLLDDSSVRSERPELMHEVFDEIVNHEYPLNWFDNEIEPLTGIDVFQQPFDHEIGYQTYHNKNFSMIVIRVDKLNKCENVLSDFLGERINITHNNQSKSKWYSPLHAEFRETYKPSIEYVERMLSSKLTKHFFSDEEINKIKNKYLQGNL